MPCRSHRTYHTRLPIQDGTLDSDRGRAIAMDDDGSMVIAGSSLGEWDIPSIGDWDMAAFKLDADGTLLWKWQVTRFRA